MIIDQFGLAPAPSPVPSYCSKLISQRYKRGATNINSEPTVRRVDRHVRRGTTDRCASRPPGSPRPYPGIERPILTASPKADRSENDDPGSRSNMRRAPIGALLTSITTGWLLRQHRSWICTGLDKINTSNFSTYRSPLNWSGSSTTSPLVGERVFSHDLPTFSSAACPSKVKM